MKFNKKVLFGTLALLLFPFTGCDLLGEKADTNLYSLTLTSNITLSDAKKEELKVELKNGFLDKDEVDDLLSAGATQEDIDKVGKLQDDGKYYFFDQNPIYIYRPDVEGYSFVGYYVDNKAIDYKGLDYNPKDGKPDSWWNAPNKDTVVEARYEFLKYNITYCDNVSGGVSSNPTNPTTYDGSKQIDVTLNDPTPIEGYEFKYWYYYEIVFDGNDNTQKEVKCTTLPNIGNEEIIHTGVNGLELTLFAYYEVADYEVSFTVDPGVMVSVRELYTEEAYDITSPFEVKYGTKIDVWVDVSEVDLYNCVFDGIYVNGEKFTSLNRDTITITKDTSIEIKTISIEE